MAHDQLRFDLVDGVHGHANHNQQRCSAEIEGDVHAMCHPVRQVLEDPTDQPKLVETDARDEECGNEGNDDQVQCTHQGDARQDVVDKVRRALAGPDSGDKGTRFAEIVRELDPELWGRAFDEAERRWPDDYPQPRLTPSDLLRDLNPDN